MSKIRVLVTGGAGYIGSHAVLALKDAGWPVAVVDDLSNGTREVVPVDVPFFEGNIADRPWVDGILQEQQIGAIMHFAGSIVVPESVEQPLKYYANNTLASYALISAAVESGVKHILFSSTAAVYGAPEQVPIVEEDPKQPINPYGASKLMTERMLEDPTYNSFNHQHYSYVARGRYLPQLEVYARLFSRERLLVLNSSLLFTRPQEAHAAALDFLGLPMVPLKEYRQHNTYDKARMTDGTEAMLVREFEADNARLYEYLGTDLGWSRRANR